MSGTIDFYFVFSSPYSYFAATRIEALAGVFGSLIFMVDDEPFWEHDRLDHLDRSVATGGR